MAKAAATRGMAAAPVAPSLKDIKKIYHHQFEVAKPQVKNPPPSSVDESTRSQKGAFRNKLLEDFRIKYMRARYNLDERREQVDELQEECSDLAAQLEEKRTEADELESVRDQLVARMNEARAAYRYEHKRKESDTDELTKLRKTKQVLLRELSSARQALTDARYDFKREIDEHMHLDGLASKLGQRLARINEERLKAKKTWRQHTELIEQYEQQLEDLKKELAEMQKVVNATFTQQ